MRPSARLVQLVPQPPLSDLSVAGARRVARTAPRGPVARRVLPRRLHRAPGRRRDRRAEQGCRLRSALPGRRRHAPNDRCRSAPPRRGDRLLRRFHTWGQTLVHHPPALRHSRWRARQRRQRLGCLPPRVLPAGTGPLTLLPPGRPRGAGRRPRVRPAPLRRPASAPQARPSASPSTFAQPARRR